MEEYNALSEEFLSAWIKMSVTISNERIVRRMPFNEAMVCNIICHHMLEEPDRQLTATELCEETHMHKTLMNRTLNSLLEKGLIIRRQNMQDKRQSFISMNEENISVFLEEHANSLKFVNCIVEKLGTDRVREAIKTFNEMADIVDEMLPQRNVS